MSRELLCRVFLCFLVIWTRACCSSEINVSRDCLDFDLAVIEDHLSRIDLGNVPTIEAMIDGFKGPVTALPFGALKSDWARLILLHKAQPEVSVLKQKLNHLFRILVIAYFQIEEQLSDRGSTLWFFKSTTTSSTAEYSSKSNLQKKPKELNNSATESIEMNTVPEGFIRTTDHSSSKFIYTTKTNASTPMDRDVIKEDSNSDRVRGDTSSFVPSESIEVEPEEKEPVGSFQNLTTRFTDLLIDNVMINNYTEALGNYSSVFDGVTSWTTEVDTTETDSNGNNGEPFVPESTSSANDFVREDTTGGIDTEIEFGTTSTLRSATSSLIRDYTSTNHYIEDKFGTDKDKFVTEESTSANQFDTEESTRVNKFVTEESTSVSKFVTEENTNVNKIPTEESTSVNAIVTEESTSVSKFVTEENTNVNKIPTEENTNVNKIPTEESTSVSKFVTEESTSVNAIVTEESTSVSKFITEESTSVSKFVTEESTGVSKFVTEESTSVSKFVTEENTSVNKIPTEESTSVSKFVTEESTNVNKIATEESTSVSKFVTEESTSVNKIVTEETTNVNKFVTTGQLNNEIELDTTSTLRITTDSFTKNDDVTNRFAEDKLNVNTNEIIPKNNETSPIDDNNEFVTFSTLESTSNHSINEELKSTEINKKIEPVATWILESNASPDPTIKYSSNTYSITTPSTFILNISKTASTNDIKVEENKNENNGSGTHKFDTSTKFEDEETTSENEKSLIKIEDKSTNVSTEPMITHYTNIYLTTTPSATPNVSKMSSTVDIDLEETTKSILIDVTISENIINGSSENDENKFDTYKNGTTENGATTFDIFKNGPTENDATTFDIFKNGITENDATTFDIFKNGTTEYSTLKFVTSKNGTTENSTPKFDISLNGTTQNFTLNFDMSTNGFNESSTPKFDMSTNGKTINSIPKFYPSTNFKDENTSENVQTVSKINSSPIIIPSTIPTVSKASSTSYTELVETTKSITINPTVAESIKYRSKNVTTESGTPTFALTQSFKYERVNGTSGNGDRAFKKLEDKDTSVFSASTNFQESSTGKETKSKSATVQYHDSNYPESATVRSSTIPNAKEEKIYVHSSEISDNEIPGSGAHFHQNRMNKGKNDIFQIFRHEGSHWNSTFPGNKIRKPPISMKAPPGNEFWKYIVRKKLSSTTATATVFDRTEEVDGLENGATRSKKRGSLNTNVEKNFRWFYNVGQEDPRDNQADSQGIDIECDGGKHVDAK